MTAARRLLAATVSRAARGYLGGTDLAGALGTCDSLARRGMQAFTFGYWNRSGDAVDSVASRYAEAVASPRMPDLAARVALKAPAISFRRDVVARLRERAPAGVGLHLDAHGIDAQDATLSLAGAAGPQGGVTFPGRWRRSVADAREAASLGLSVRVVKGQFPASAREEVPPREGFLDVVDALAGSAAHVFVATHDARLAREALKRLLAHGTTCELELLYGLPPAASLAVADELGVPARVYVPWGEAYLPYALESARRQPRVFAWLARDFFLGRRRWPVSRRCRSRCSRADPASPSGAAGGDAKDRRRAPRG